MGRRLRSRLDLMKPDLTETVQSKQLKQKLTHDNKKSFRKFSEGDAVYIEDFSHAKPKWVSGTIQKPTDPVLFCLMGTSSRDMLITSRLDTVLPPIQQMGQNLT